MCLHDHAVATSINSASDYSSIAWSSSPPREERGAYYNYLSDQGSYRPALSKLEVALHDIRRKVQIVFKAVRGLLSSPIFSFYKRRSSIISRTTRNSDSDGLFMEQRL